MLIVLLCCPHACARSDEQDGDGEHAQQQKPAHVVVRKFRCVHDYLSNPFGIVTGSKIFRVARPFNIFALTLE
jgi:hypothetical protein